MLQENELLLSEIGTGPSFLVEELHKALEEIADLKAETVFLRGEKDTLVEGFPNLALQFAASSDMMVALAKVQIVAVVVGRDIEARGVFRSCPDIDIVVIPPESSSVR